MVGLTAASTGADANPYRPPRSAGNRNSRAFPLLIQYRRYLAVPLQHESLVERLARWAGRHGYRLEIRNRSCIRLSRACRWWALFAWRIEHVPTRIYCRHDHASGTVSLHLVCRHDWAVALPGDDARLRRELEQLQQALAGDLP
ncbi:MAG: hypothetical protein KatS3mg110_3543 [Pirellulaceae bacterium]|nr:MAG: hypothetical protein KatS3mg110_3543 [Pirellulaceae bacterium]